MVESKVFKSNYVRTGYIKSRIANSVSNYFQRNKPVWINNGINEKFIPSNNVDNFLSNGYTLGRLKTCDSSVKASISSKEVRKQKRNGTYVPTKKALYKKELRKRKFLELLEVGNSDVVFIVSKDGKEYKRMKISDIRESDELYRPHAFWD